MNAKGKILALGLATAVGVEALAGPHATPPSPPRCSADGTCYPKRETWGFYGTRWRTWPGVDVGVPTPAEPEVVPALPDRDQPTPQEEEQHAPPQIEPTTPEEGEEPPGVTPDTPPLTLPPLPFLTPPSVPAPAPAPGTTPPDEAPPTLPFGTPMPPTVPPVTPLRPLPGTPPTTPVPEVSPAPQGSRLQLRGLQQPATVNEQDAPPALPLHFTNRTLPPRPMEAGQPSIPPRRLPTVASGERSVVTASAVSTGERPRAVPAVYTPASDPPPALPAFRN